MAHLATRAVDVVITSAQASATRVMNIARQAQQLQPGVRVIVLASTLTADDIVAALKNQVYTCFTLPAPPEDLRSTIRQALADDNWQSGIEVISAVPHWIALRVACRRVNAERLTHFMNELAGDLSATERYQLITAFREVLLNAMEHGAGFDPDKVVEVHAVRTIRTLVYYFKDPGPGFDVHAPQMVASEDDPAQPSRRARRPGQARRRLRHAAHQQARRRSALQRARQRSDSGQAPRLADARRRLACRVALARRDAGVAAGPAARRRIGAARSLPRRVSPLRRRGSSSRSSTKTRPGRLLELVPRHADVVPAVRPAATAGMRAALRGRRRTSAPRRRG